MRFKAKIRGQDKFGSGVFGASRGRRKHKGIDVVCEKGDSVQAVLPGVVTRLGYPYSPNNKKKGFLRYVEVTCDGLRYRYFYVKPEVAVGDQVEEGQVLGVAQGLTSIYPGITDHFHFEILRSNGEPIDPTDYVDSEGM